MLLVTGAAGLSGSTIVREFARQNVKVRALVRSLAKARILEGLPTVEVVEGDMLQPKTLGAGLQGVDRVLLISSANAQLVETQCTFIDACKKSGVDHIVKFSGAESGVDRQKFRFTRMHDEIERYLESSGLTWTHLRPSQFMQVYLREAPTIIAKNAFYLPMDKARLEPVDLEDVAKVASALMRSPGHEGKSYDMTGPEELTMAEIAERISAAIGKTIHYINITPEEHREVLLAKGLAPFFVDAVEELFRERRQRPGSKVFLGTHDAFGVQPTTFAQFARANAAIFSGEGQPG